MREFDLIARLGERLCTTRADTCIGIGDDGAVLAPGPGMVLVVTTDTLIGGRHFPHDTPAFDVGYKAIAVNFSDLGAMGAEPAWLTLALSLPALDASWCDDFIDGVQAAIGASAAAVVGGDTTRGALAVTVTALGQLPARTALTRAGARVGDLIAITGALGDAAYGLRAWPHRAEKTDPNVEYVIARLCRPAWRPGARLRGLVRAAIDVSDGLAADLGHLLAASGVGARIDVDRLPCSPALQRLVGDAQARQRLQLCGGDDYELAVTLGADRLDAARAALDCDLSVIGVVEAAPGQRYVDRRGRAVAFDPPIAPGWDHFA